MKLVRQLSRVSPETASLKAEAERKEHVGPSLVGRNMMPVGAKTHFLGPLK